MQVVKNMEDTVEEKIMKKLCDDIDDQWVFVLEAAAKYKKEFRKTLKIGIPPKIDDILEKTVLEDDEEHEGETNKKE